MKATLRYFCIACFFLGLSLPLMIAADQHKEMIYIHTDRNVYIAGEEVYFKLYLLNSHDKHLSPLSKVAFLILRSTQSNQIIQLRLSVNFGISTGSLLLPDTLSTGKYEIVSYTRWMKNTGEDLYFRKELIIYNRFEKQTDNFSATSEKLRNTYQSDTSKTIVLNKQIFASREQVVVQFKKPLPEGNYSVSVHEIPQIPVISPGIQEFVSKTTDFTPSDKSASVYTAPDIRSNTLRGFVTNQTTRLPGSHVVVILSTPDTVPNMQYVVTKADGSFQFPLTKYYDGKKLFLSVKDNPSTEKLQITIENPYDLQLKWLPNAGIKLIQNESYIQKSKQIAYIHKVYPLPKSRPDETMNKSNIHIPRFSYGEKITVYPADFFPLPDFFEIAVELLPKVRIQKKDTEYYFQVSNKLTHEFDPLRPAVFLNGVYVEDISDLLKLNSEQIFKIEVIDNQRAFGDLIFGGMISVITHDNIFKTKYSEPKTIFFNDKPLARKGFEVINPKQLQQKNHPFLLQLLYWSSEIKDKFEFYTSDNEGKFIIQVEGISNEGIPVSIYNCFEVKNENPQ